MRRLVLLMPAILLAAAPCFAATASKPTGVQLTIYNQNFALVKEERTMTLGQGINFVPVEGVAASIEPSSVAFKSLTDPASVAVREQNYQYDLVSYNTILDKSVGKRLKFRRFLDSEVREEEGILLSTPKNGLILQTSTGIILNPGGEIEITELPEGLVARPTLVWKLETNKPGTHRTEISYLANQITWSADYVAVVDPLDKYLDLTGWVTLDNKSGATYEDASLNLMAGDVHRVQPEMDRMYKGFAAGRAAEMEPQFAEKAFFEYHLYTLKDKTTVKDKETKQITLLTANRVPAKKIYIYDGRETWWRSWRYRADYRPGESYDVSSNKKVNVLMEIVNRKDDNLGIPLPKGKVRVYKQESDANQHFIGEDLIDHTPKDEKIRLYLGDAFDIVGEHTRTNFRRISSREVEESFEISLRNHKDAPVNIVVVEHLTGDWKIIESSHEYHKKDASTVEIPVEVPKDGEVKITYTVRTKW